MLVQADVPTPLQRIVASLLARDPRGRTWLGSLLAATPRGRAQLGELVDDPGYLETPLAVMTEAGRLGCFTYPAAPTRELLAWYIDDPIALTRPADDAGASTQTRVLRRALLDDDPPGSRARAQDRAHDLLRASAPRAPSWWRFEDPGILDCTLLTERLVLTITAPATVGLAPVTPWYPRRAVLIRDAEAGRRLAGGRAWASLLIDDATPEAVADPGAVARLVDAGTPHLDAAERDQLAAGYLGRLSFDELRAAVGAGAPPLRPAG